ncbi:MAG: response regulator [Pseudomonadota bacterium]
MNPEKAIRVLVVEDDATTRFMMSELCEAFGLNARVVSSGTAFLALVERQPDVADVILMDIHMPLLSGADATSKMRSKRSHPPRGVPVVALTSDRTWADQKKREYYGIDAYLQKPVSPHAMVSLVERLAH